MSILNVLIQHEHALVCVDTHRMGALGGEDHIAKLFPLVHMNAVLACRGNALFWATLCGMSISLGGSDLDTLLERMNVLLKTSFQQFLQAAPALGMPDTAALDGQTIVAVGWSRRKHRMLAREYTQETRSAGFVEEVINPHHLAPWCASIDDLANRFTATASGTDMERLARAQVGLLHDKAPGASAGGSLIVVRLHRDSMTILNRGKLRGTTDRLPE